MTLVELFFAAVLGLLVWAIGAIFDKDPSNRNARFAGFVVFVVAVLTALVGLWSA